MYARHWTEVQDWRWEHFSPSEMACRGTGELLVDEAALDRLAQLREMLGRPMIVNSAYRSEKHNRAVGGAKNSLHRKGVAFDISMANHDPAYFEDCARACGFTGFGFYPASNFMHIDTGRARTWGKRFAERENRFATERRPKEKLGKSGTVKGGTVAGGVTLGQVAHEASAIQQKANDVAYQWSAGDFFGIAIGLITLAGIGYMLYRRWDDAGRPRLRDVFGDLL